MTEITVLSGKGGTGKTSITAALASVAGQAVFCDNDVDAADLHLIFIPEKVEEHQFSSGRTAFIEPEKCIQCGICEQHCRFGAISIADGQYQINPYQCEGCLLCERTCPQKAIYTEENLNNYWYVSNSRFGKLVHAQMGPGEENSGKLVTQVRRRAKEIATEIKARYIINDGPPGIGCATISSLSGTNKVLLVIEPTLSGLHDVKRLVELIESFDIKTYAVINKYTINQQVTEEIEQFLKIKEIPLLAKIPFEKEIVESMIFGKTIVEHIGFSEIAEQIHYIWEKLSEVS